jgi:DNA repair exonuclease SbcCD ATPase subunit
MLNFRQLSIQNFGSFKEAEIEFPESGLVLILGNNEDSGFSSSNGSGKSTILESLAWCLFGKTTKGLRGDEVVFNGMKKDQDCVVETKFWLRNQLCSIERGRRGGKKPYCDFYINSASKVEVSELNLPISWDLFTNTTYFSQERLERFATSPDSHKKKILREIMNLDRFTQYKEIAKELRLKIRRKLDGNDGNRIHVDAQIQSLGKKLNADQTRLKTSIEDLEDEHERNKEELEKNKSLYGEKLSEITDIRDAALAILGQINEKKIAKQFNSLEGRVKQLEKTFRDHIRSIEVIKGSICPLCRQRFPEEKKQAVKTRIQNTKGAELDKESQKLARLREKIVRVEAIRLKQQNIFDNASDIYPEYYAKKISILDRLEQLEESYKVTIDLVRSAAENIKGLKKEIGALTKKRNQIKKQEALLKSQLSYIDFWITGFSDKGLPSFLLDDSLPFLNEAVNTYLGFLAPEFDLYFDTQREKTTGGQAEDFTILIDDDPRKYYSLSGGERKRIDLAILFGLSSYQNQFVPTNLLFLDEIFANLDKIGCNAVLELLAYEKKQGRTIFVITHLDDIQDSVLWDQVLVVTKKNGVATIHHE